MVITDVHHAKGSGVWAAPRRKSGVGWEGPGRARGGDGRGGHEKARMYVRLVAMASISSMKMMAGAFSRARRNTSRTMRGPGTGRAPPIHASAVATRGRPAHRRRPYVAITDVHAQREKGGHNAPSPRYFCTNSEPTTRMKEADVWCATALTSIVLPVPGGPYSSTPLPPRWATDTQRRHREIVCK
jgi:hypothetical protein